LDREGRTIWIVDAHGYGKRFIVRADEEGKRKKKHKDVLSQMAGLAAQLPVLHKQLDDVHASMRNIKSELDASDLLRARGSLPANTTH